MSEQAVLFSQGNNNRRYVIRDTMQLSKATIIASYGRCYIQIDVSIIFLLLHERRMSLQSIDSASLFRYQLKSCKLPVHDRFFVHFFFFKQKRQKMKIHLCFMTRNDFEEVLRSHKFD